MVSLIKELLDWQQLSPTQFADRIGIGRPVISHILSERNKPSLDVIRSIKVAFPEVSTDWLLSGSGPMLAAEAAAQPATTPVQEASLAPTGPAPSPASTTEPDVAEAPTPANPSLGSSQPAAEAASALAPPPAPTALPAPARFQAGKLTPQATSKALTGVVSPPSPLATSVVEAAPLGPAAGAEATSAIALAPTAPVAPAPAAGSVPHPAENSAAAAPSQSAATPPQAAAPDAAVLAAGLAEPGKAIRRIVIFYRDGSFADYQPE